MGMVLTLRSVGPGRVGDVGAAARGIVAAVCQDGGAFGWDWLRPLVVVGDRGKYLCRMGRSRLPPAWMVGGFVGGLIEVVLHDVMVVVEILLERVRGCSRGHCFHVHGHAREEGDRNPWRPHGQPKMVNKGRRGRQWVASRNAQVGIARARDRIMLRFRLIMCSGCRGDTDRWVRKVMVGMCMVGHVSRGDE